MLDSLRSRMRATSLVERLRTPRLSGGRAAAGRLLLALGPRGLADALRAALRGGVALGEAALQRFDEVDDLLARLGARGRDDLLAGGLAVDRGDQRRAVLVLVARGREGLLRELEHQLLREVDLAGLERDVLAELDLVEAAHLVGVVEAVQHEPALHRAHEHEV